MQQIQISSAQQLLLKHLYPTVDWQLVRYYQPLPWFMKDNFIAAMALPATYSNKLLDIHFKNCKIDDCYSLATLVHECYHVFQYQQFKAIYDFGYFRRFMAYYLGWYVHLWVSNIIKYRFDFQRTAYESYRFHPFEIPAYEMEAKFIDWYKQQPQDTLNFEQADFLGLVAKKLDTETRPPIWSLLIGSFLSFSIVLVKPTLELGRFLYSFVRGKKQTK
jgi:hypothetical protein